MVSLKRFGSRDFFRNAVTRRTGMIHRYWCAFYTAHRLAAPRGSHGGLKALMVSLNLLMDFTADDSPFDNVAAALSARAQQPPFHHIIFT